MLVRRPSKHLAACYSVVGVGSMHDDLNQVSQRIDNDMTLSALYLLASVDAALFIVGSRFGALRIYDAVAGRGFFAVFFRCL